MDLTLEMLKESIGFKPSNTSTLSLVDEIDKHIKQMSDKDLLFYSQKDTGFKFIFLDEIAVRKRNSKKIVSHQQKIQKLKSKSRNNLRKK